MSVELDPVELGFRRPFNREVDEKLRIRNPNNEPVAFKVKTTAPKQYCVRPNSGRIEPGQSVEVSVLLQAMKEDPPLEAKCRDKFLVQSVGVSADQEVSNAQTIWSNTESMSKSSIQEKKIRVNFLPASQAASITTPMRQSTATAPESLPAYNTPDSPTQVSSTPPTSKPQSRQIDAAAPAAAPVQASAPAPVTTSNASATTSDEVKTQLREAQEAISRLTEQLKEQGLRQRKAPEASKERDERSTNVTSGITSSLGMEQAPNGVPVPITAALCLLSFLIAYVLF